MQKGPLDHGQTSAAIVTEENLAPVFLPHPPKPVAGERYVLKTLAESPEAHLTHKVELWPAGSVLLISTNGGLESFTPTRLT